MNLQPTLTGKLIRLQPLLKSDFEKLYEVASDPLIWEQHPHPDRYQKNIFEKFFSEAIKSNGAFAVVDIETDKIIGTSRYYNFDPVKKMVMVGYTFLARKYWGGQYNFEMKQLMLDYAFNSVTCVFFEVGEFNFRSQKALQKIGAKFDKRVEELSADGKVLVKLAYKIEHKIKANI